MQWIANIQFASEPPLVRCHFIARYPDFNMRRINTQLRRLSSTTGRHRILVRIAFHLAFFIAAVRIAGMDREAKEPGELEELRVVFDLLLFAAQNNTLEIVIPVLPDQSAKMLKTLQMSRQEEFKHCPWIKHPPGIPRISGYPNAPDKSYNLPAGNRTFRLATRLNCRRLCPSPSHSLPRGLAVPPDQTRIVCSPVPVVLRPASMPLPGLFVLLRRHSGFFWRQFFSFRRCRYSWQESAEQYRC